MLPFIDIHTHQKYDDTTKFIYNSFLDFDKNLEFQSIGIHPYHVDNLETSFNKINKINLSQSQIFAIGECGLDKRFETFSSLQKIAFHNQILLANQIKKPIIIHCVKAYQEVLEMLTEAKTHVIFHGFNKNYQIAKQLINKGYFISVGIDIIKNPEKYSELLQSENLDYIFFETDDSQIHIKEVYKKASEISDVDITFLLYKTHHNFMKCFTK